MADVLKYDGAPKPSDVEVIDWLRPGTPQHAFALDYFKARISYSERKMQRFYARWRHNEFMLQAYVSMKDFDGIMDRMESNKEAPGVDDSPVAINVPFAWATINTIVTYLLHMFGGRRPIFQVGSYRSEQVNRAKNMEMYLQYNADVVKFIRALYFFLMDGETYGVSVMKTLWKQESKTRNVTIPPSPDLVQISAAQGLPSPVGETRPQNYISFEGNSIANVDPFMFFPDPRVPMHEVAEKGEWVAWRAFQGRHSLLKEQSKGRLKWVDTVDPFQTAIDTDSTSPKSARGIVAGGYTPDDRYSDRDGKIAPNLQVDQGSFEIIPSDLGWGDSDAPEKWVVSMLNKRQIVQASPLGAAHDKHPIVVAEPNSVGYSFGQLGSADMVGPLQELMSWFINSHIFNVRAALNNMLVVDPTKVEMQDVLNPKPGKIIRLKNTAFGLSDPKTAISQLAVTDVTRQHLGDYQLFSRMAADLSGATDNNRGLQDAGGRKTATEIRTAADAGTSRLAAKGKVYSSMAFVPLAEMWSTNAQEFITQDFEMSVLGQTAQGNDSIRMNADALDGDFVFPVNDGTLPADKLALLDVWKEIFLAISQDPQLRQNYDMLDMFDWISQLGGAQNIKNFRLNIVPQTQQMQALGGPGMPQPADAGGAGVPMQQVLAALANQGRF